MSELPDLEPRALWSIFHEICAIPHPSHHEEALALWAVERARSQGFAVLRDAAGNVVVSKPASPGLGWKPGVILQAHLDMVPQKTSDSAHDFLCDPIRPRVDPADPEWLRATATTLGADDGIGVVAGFAILEDSRLRHGPLELLLTLNEEDGMTGAHDLAPGLLAGSILLNLDCEEEEAIGVGSAGSRRVHFGFTEAAESPAGDLAWLEVGVSGGRGGHSGGDIHLGRANAIRALLELLAPEAGGIRLARIGGGSLANAIARDATALVGIPLADGAALMARLADRGAGLRSRFSASDPDIRIEVAPASGPATSLGLAATARVIGAIAAIPDGCLSLLEDMDGVARLSSNLGALETAALPDAMGGSALAIRGKLLVRAAFDPERMVIVDQIAVILHAAGAQVELRPELAAWSPNLGSPLLSTARRVWKECRGEEALVRTTHGGLECSLIRATYPGLDMVSIGPTIRFPHSPDEAVHIASVGRFFTATLRLVEALGM